MLFNIDIIKFMVFNKTIIILNNYLKQYVVYPIQCLLKIKKETFDMHNLEMGTSIKLH